MRKHIFEAVRDQVPDVWDDPERIVFFDGVLDDLGVNRDSETRKTGPKGIALIKEFEGCHRKRPDGLIEAYPDPATGGDPWTIGWGATGPGIRKGVTWTQQQCDDRLIADLARFEKAVEDATGGYTNQNQFDALVSFAYNLGPENLKRSTLLRKHMEGDHDGAAREFQKWNRAAGRVLRGLTRRREAEAELYQNDDT